MNAFLNQTTYFGFFISIFIYLLFVQIQKKTKLVALNPLLMTIITIIIILKIGNVTYTVYEKGASCIQFFLTPATVCLAVPLYKQKEILRKNVLVVFSAIAIGVITTFLSVLAVVRFTGEDKVFYVSMLPKSITTAIGMDVSGQLGGIVTITITVIITTGIVGSIMSSVIFRLGKIKDPIAQGLALGTSAHAIGTSKALTMGEIQGAMSSIAIAIAGLLTVLMAGIAAQWI